LQKKTVIPNGELCENVSKLRWAPEIGCLKSRDLLTEENHQV